MQGVVIRRHGTASATGVDGPLRLWIVRGIPSVAEVHAVFREAARSLKELPAGIVVISIIEPGAMMPPDEVRAAVARNMETLSANTLASVIVAEGGIFRLAALRALIAGLGMIRRRRFPETVLGSIEEVAQWLLPNTASVYPELTQARIAGLAKETRQSLDL